MIKYIYSNKSAELINNIEYFYCCRDKYIKAVNETEEIYIYPANYFDVKVNDNILSLNCCNISGLNKVACKRVGDNESFILDETFFLLRELFNLYYNEEMVVTENYSENIVLFLSKYSNYITVDNDQSIISLAAKRIKELQSREEYITNESIISSILYIAKKKIEELLDPGMSISNNSKFTEFLKGITNFTFIDSSYNNDALYYIENEEIRLDPVQEDLIEIKTGEKNFIDWTKDIKYIITGDNYFEAQYLIGEFNKYNKEYTNEVKKKSSVETLKDYKEFFKYQEYDVKSRSQDFEELIEDCVQINETVVESFYSLEDYLELFDADNRKIFETCFIFSGRSDLKFYSRLLVLIKENIHNKDLVSKLFVVAFKTMKVNSYNEGIWELLDEVYVLAFQYSHLDLFIKLSLKLYEKFFIFRDISKEKKKLNETFKKFCIENASLDAIEKDLKLDNIDSFKKYFAIESINTFYEPFNITLKAENYNKDTIEKNKFLGMEYDNIKIVTRSYTLTRYLTIETHWIKNNLFIEQLIENLEKRIEHFLLKKQPTNMLYVRVLSLISVKNNLKIRYNIDNNKWNMKDLIDRYRDEIFYLYKKNVYKLNNQMFSKVSEDLSKIHNYYMFFSYNEDEEVKDLLTIIINESLSATRVYVDLDIGSGGVMDIIDEMLVLANSAMFSSMENKISYDSITTRNVTRDYIKGYWNMPRNTFDRHINKKNKFYNPLLEKQVDYVIKPTFLY